MGVAADLHQVGFRGVGDEADRGVVAQHEGEALDVETLDAAVPVEGGEGLVGVELLDEEHVALVFVDQVEGRGVEGAVAEDGEHLVALLELAEVLAVAVLVELLDVGVVPDVLTGDGADALALEGDGADGVLGHEVAARRLALDAQLGEIVLEAGLLELRLGPQGHAYGLGLAVVVGREPDDLRAGLAGGDVVFLVARDGGDGEALGEVDRTLAHAVDDVVDGAGVAAVEQAHVQQVLAEEGLVLHLGDAVLAVLADDDDLGEVGAVADVLAAVVALEADAHEAFGEVGLELGVVVDDLGGGDGLEARELGAARVVLAVFLLEGLEPVDGVAVDVLDVVAHGLHLVFQGQDLLVDGLGVELGDLADRLLHELEDVVEDDLAAEEVLVHLHLGEDVLDLGVPVLLVLLEDLVDAVLEEDALQGAVVPVGLELVELDLQLLQEDVAGVEGAVLEDVAHREELRFVVLDHAGVGGDVDLAVRERVECVDGLVGRDVVGQVDEDVHLVRGHVLDLLDLDLALVLGLEDGVDEVLGVLAVGDLRDGDGVLVDLLDAGADLDGAAAAAGEVLAAVGEAAGGEVGIDLVGLALEDRHGGVEQFVEVVREDLGGEAHADAFRTLREQEREADRELGGLLVAPVVGVHPVGDLRVEHHLLGELAQARLDVSRRGVGVAGEDVAPVALAVDGEAFLPELDEGAEDGGVTVGVVLHGLAHDVGDLGVGAVVHPVHRVEDAALHGLETVHDVGDGPVQDHVGGIVQVPVLEHAGELELVCVALQQLVVAA